MPSPNAHAGRPGVLRRRARPRGVRPAARARSAAATSTTRPSAPATAALAPPLGSRASGHSSTASVAATATAGWRSDGRQAHAPGRVGKRLRATCRPGRGPEPRRGERAGEAEGDEQERGEADGPLGRVALRGREAPLRRQRARDVEARAVGAGVDGRLALTVAQRGVEREGARERALRGRQVPRPHPAEHDAEVEPAERVVARWRRPHGAARPPPRRRGPGGRAARRGRSPPDRRVLSAHSAPRLRRRAVAARPARSAAKAAVIRNSGFSGSTASARSASRRPRSGWPSASLGDRGVQPQVRDAEVRVVRLPSPRSSRPARRRSRRPRRAAPRPRARRRRAARARNTTTSARPRTSNVVASGACCIATSSAARSVRSPSSRRPAATSAAPRLSSASASRPPRAAARRRRSGVPRRRSGGAGTRSRRAGSAAATPVVAARPLARGALGMRRDRPPSATGSDARPADRRA